MTTFLIFAGIVIFSAYGAALAVCGVYSRSWKFWMLSSLTLGYGIVNYFVGKSVHP